MFFETPGNQAKKQLSLKFNKATGQKSSMAEGLEGFFFGIYTSEAILHWSGTFGSLGQDLKILNKNEVIQGHFL